MAFADGARTEQRGQPVLIAALATGVGNVGSVVRALERVIPSGTVRATADPAVVGRADVLVVPGQGSFGAFAAAVEGELATVLRARIASGVPYFGICLGLQILFEESDEAPGARGLGVLRGRVHRLAPGIDPGAARPYALPHVGWNRVEPLGPNAALLAADHYYFAHSFVGRPEDPSVVLARTTYGDETFVAAVARDNVVGVQFHPEKSQRAGLALIERFFARVVK